MVQVDARSTCQAVLIVSRLELSSFRRSDVTNSASPEPIGQADLGPGVKMVGHTLKQVQTKSSAKLYFFHPIARGEIRA